MKFLLALGLACISFNSLAYEKQCNRSKKDPRRCFILECSIHDDEGKVISKFDGEKGYGYFDYPPLKDKKAEIKIYNVTGYKHTSEKEKNYKYVYGISLKVLFRTLTQTYNHRVVSEGRIAEFKTHNVWEDDPDSTANGYEITFYSQKHQEQKFSVEFAYTKRGFWGDKERTLRCDVDMSDEADPEF